MNNSPEPVSIPFGRPMLGDAETTAVQRVLEGPTLVHGPLSREFESKFAARAGAKYGICVSSCTAGLHLSMLVNGIGPSDTVAVPAMTHVATAHAGEFCGARPLFVDVEPDTGNMNPEALEGSLDASLRGIEVVHYLGLPCDMDRIIPISINADAIIIEDCALAVDAEYDGSRAGTLGLVGCFSFYPIKHMTTIEGGMVLTDNENIAKAINQHKAFGYDRPLGNRAKPGIYDVTELGYNYRMSEVQAAIGLAQLDRLDSFQAARAKNHRILKMELDEIDEVTVFSARKGKSSSSHYCLNAVLPRDGSINRDKVVSELKAAGIGTSVHYPSAVPLFTYYRDKYGYRPGQFPVAEWLASQTISLPVGPHLDTTDAEYIGKKVKAAILKARI